MRAPAAAGGRRPGRPAKPLGAKVPAGPKPRAPNPRLAGGDQKDLQRARPAWRGAQWRADDAIVVSSSSSDSESESEREVERKRMARGRPPGSKSKVGRELGGLGGASESSAAASNSSEAESGGDSSDDALLAGPWDEGDGGWSDDGEGGAGLPGWAAGGAAAASATEVLLYALLVLVELGGCPQRVDAFTRAVRNKLTTGARPLL